MNISRSAKNDEIIVTEHRPGFRIVMAFVMVGFVGLAGLFSYGFGVEQGKKTDAQMLVKMAEIEAALAASQTGKADLQYKVADLEFAKNVDHLANNELMSTVHRLEAELADLKGEISYYRNLFQPELVTGDLLIEGWEMQSLGKPNLYEYRLMLTQMSKNGDLVSGSVDIEIQGKQNGVDVSVPLEAALNSVEQPLEFSFRYFQNMSGQFSIPDDFQPSTVQLVARTDGQKTRLYERNYQWPFSGG